MLIKSYARKCTVNVQNMSPISAENMAWRTLHSTDTQKHKRCFLTVSKIACRTTKFTDVLQTQKQRTITKGFSKASSTSCTRVVLLQSPSIQFVTGLAASVCDTNLLKSGPSIILYVYVLD